jgi:hypothetical protein
MVMPRSRSSGARSIRANGTKELRLGRRSASTLVMAAVSVVLPWSTWPMVPIFRWGLSRQNGCFAMVIPCSWS